MDPFTIGGYVLALLLGVFGFRMKRGDIWKEEAEAQKAKADRLEKDLTAFRAEFETYKSDTSSRIERLETENRRLAELASGREAVDALSQKVEANHLQVMAALAAK